MFSPGNLRATFDNPAYEKLISYYIGEKYTLRYTGGMVGWPQPCALHRCEACPCLACLCLLCQNCTCFLPMHSPDPKLSCPLAPVCALQ